MRNCSRNIPQTFRRQTPTRRRDEETTMLRRDNDAAPATTRPSVDSHIARVVEIVHVDPHLVVVDKPAGMLSVPGRGEDKADCLYSRLLVQYDDALVVHRLHRATSGPLLFPPLVGVH